MTCGKQEKVCEKIETDQKNIEEIEELASK